MKVVVLGASGIIGQHLRRWQLASHKLDVIYTSRSHLPWAQSVRADFTTEDDVVKFCTTYDPDVIINLLGENRPDVVEIDPDKYWFINVEVPLALKRWVQSRNRWLIHVSTQGVFGGTRPPYRAESIDARNDLPVNAYGNQKLAAEHLLMLQARQVHVIIVRLTFVLGVRPFRDLGRVNPLEMIYANVDGKTHADQVSDRYFSPCFANDAAAFLWQLIGTLTPLDPLLERYVIRRRYFNIGLPMRINRYGIAIAAGANLGQQRGQFDDTTAFFRGVQHDVAFPTAAQRPYDTTFDADAVHDETWEEAINTTTAEWRIRMDRTSEHDRALELALFLGMREGEARVKLMRGFGVMHTEVAKDFIAAKSQKVHSWTDFDLLTWYQKTDAYLWELTAYHLDKGFNYEGMARGIAEHIVKEYGERSVVVALGDGIGDLTMTLLEHNLDAVYNDLLGSRTAQFAAFRFQRHGKTPLSWLTDGWAPPAIDRASMLHGRIKAIVALDFFEHMPNVEEWIKACHALLEPGGVLMAVNAFAIGDEEHGNSIPMHLARNNVYADPDPKTGEAGWDVLLRKVGFIDLKNGWRQKPGT